MSNLLPYILGSGGICPECDSDNTTYNPEYGFRTCEDCANIWGREEDDPDYDEEPPLDLGACCACGREASNTRNIMMLEYRAPVPGTGWGCAVCNLPADGAIAVVCNACLESKAKILWVVLGYPHEKKRALVSNLSSAIFKHTTELHEREMYHENSR